MRPLCFLVPSLDLRAGGHTAQLRFSEVAGALRTVTVATYRLRDGATPFLDDILASEEPERFIYLVHWGPHVPALLRRLSRYDVVYCAHSTGYRFCVRPSVPIVAVSRHSLAYWGRRAPSSPLFYLPNVLPEEFRFREGAREIDVLVQRRKSSRYLLRELVPELRERCAVTVIDTWVEDLAALFNRSKVYLYDSTEFWSARGISEGHGLPPLEALACGCTVFSSLNDGLADYLDPGFNCSQVRRYAKGHDAERVLGAVRAWRDTVERRRTLDAAVAPYRRANVEARMAVILDELEEFFAARSLHHPDIEPITGAARRRRWRAWLDRGLPRAVRERARRAGPPRG